MTKTYLTVTTRISDQVISEITPRIDCSAGLAELDQRLAHRIKRRGADIAIDDAERGDRQAANQAAFQGLSFTPKLLPSRKNPACCCTKRRARGEVSSRA